MVSFYCFFVTAFPPARRVGDDGYKHPTAGAPIDSEGYLLFFLTRLVVCHRHLLLRCFVPPLVGERSARKMPSMGACVMLRIVRYMYMVPVQSVVKRKWKVSTSPQARFSLMSHLGDAIWHPASCCCSCVRLISIQLFFLSALDLSLIHI